MRSARNLGPDSIWQCYLPNWPWPCSSRILPELPREYDLRLVSSAGTFSRGWGFDLLMQLWTSQLGRLECVVGMDGSRLLRLSCDGF